MNAQHIPTALEKLAIERSDYHKAQAAKVKKYLVQYPGYKYVRNNSFLLTGIGEDGIPVYKAPLNSEAAISTGASNFRNLSLGLNLQGEGLTVGIWDDGLVKDHIELDNRIISKEGPSEQTHTTHVTGTIIASGIGNIAAKGMAPKAKASTWYFDNDDAEMAALARPDQTSLLFSNHSYGTVTGWYKPGGVWIWSGNPAISSDEDYRHGFYSQSPQVLDRIAFLAPYYTIVWAAGNDRGEVGDGSTHPPDGNGGTGYDCLIPEAVAKNIITVGAVNKVVTYANPGSVVMSNFSSWGPTDDGRIKPDLVGAGVSIFSLSAAGTNQYAVQSGTSMATPNVTGSLMLVQELYTKLHGGNFMRSATLKGLAIHTAKEAGGFPGPDYSFGWGLLDVSAAANVLLREDNENIFVNELSLNNGQSYTQEINTQANQKITVTICWTDPEGNPVSPALDPLNKMLINDLDVRIVDDLGNVQTPWILNPGSPASQATTGDNFRDNVEKIEFSNPAAKKYTIRVTHKGQLLNGTQNFSLIVTHKSSLTSGTNYYWIGNSGDWSNGVHWSLTSGGVAANAVPGINDNVFFDENSFDGVSTRTVSLTTDASCKKAIWLTEKSSEIALNNHRLTMKNSFSVAAKNFKVSTEGTFRFESNAANTLNILSGNMRKASLEFNGGNWTILGNLHAKKIDVLKGSLFLRDKTCHIETLQTSANTTLDISGSTIDSLEHVVIHGLTTLVSDNSMLRIYSAAALTLNDHLYNGEILVEENKQLELVTSGTVNELTVKKGATLKFTPGIITHFSVVTLAGESGNTIKIQATAKATLDLLTHNKYCFDHLDISNVDVTGNSIVNAGLNSSLTDSGNWLKQDCSTVLYPDFTANFTCLNALTAFSDNSSGNITSWSWDFGDTGSAANSSEKKNAVHKFSDKGIYTVSLTISDGTVSRTFLRNVEIGDSNQPTNSIISSGASLLSVKQALNYQWYKDDELIEGAVSRSYVFNGTEGSYVVVTQNTTCNYVSQPFLITSLEDVSGAIQIFPNPAKDFIKLKLNPSTNGQEVVLYDLIGRPLLRQHTAGIGATLDVRTIKEGIYVLEINSSTHQLRRKVIIDHGD
jgi:hypothetical protein